MSNKSRFDELNEVDNEDFLEVDKPIPGQNFVCLSFVSPDKLLGRKEDYYFHEYNKKRFKMVRDDINEKFNKVMDDCLDGKVDLGKLNELQKLFNKSADEQINQDFSFFVDELKDFRYANEDAIEEKFHEDNNFQTSVRGIKVRGVYNTLKEAQIRSKVLQRIDPTFHIFVGQVGYWLPWDPNADKIENQEYLNSQLNEIVKKYKENENKRDEFYEQQKQEKKKQSLKKTTQAQSDVQNQEGTRMATGSSNDPEVSMETTAKNLDSMDPWMARKLETTQETTQTETVQEDCLDEEQ